MFYDKRIESLNKQNTLIIIYGILIKIIHAFYKTLCNELFKNNAQHNSLSPKPILQQKNQSKDNELNSMARNPIKMPDGNELLDNKGKQDS